MTGKIPLDLYDVLISSEQSLNCKSRIPSLCSGCSNESCYFANINKMLMMIDSSAKTLCISMYIFSHQQILWAVREAHERGVKVRVIIDHRMIQRNSLLHKLLHNRGVPIRTKKSGDNIMHHKLCLIDAEGDDREPVPTSGCVFDIPSTGAAMLGSQNYCTKGLVVNFDNTIITTDVAIIEPLQKEFNRMWDDFKPVDFNSL
uniref:Mitochondrial cardiolipin hydrolase n=1 Tax=Xenopsylla cheopis TaxID=163159 RepID=A0A6M2DDB1_XENCH